MSDQQQEIAALIEKIEAGQVSPASFRCLETPMHDMRYTQMPRDARHAFGGSFDAALSLFDALLPRWKWGRQWTGLMWVEPDDMPGRSERYYGKHDAPATALLLATLHAHKAKICPAPNSKEAKQ